ncbi:hypothetical protein BDZ89DRAFT_1144152 [Hymenopellis radicata]|nr:hypothetical protein BDZ89DRAFT_1144152 [Hymenopellis radicata]
MQVAPKDVRELLLSRGIDLDHHCFLILQSELRSIADIIASPPSKHGQACIEHLRRTNVGRVNYALDKGQMIEANETMGGGGKAASGGMSSQFTADAIAPNVLRNYEEPAQQENMDAQTRRDRWSHLGHRSAWRSQNKPDAGDLARVEKLNVDIKQWESELELLKRDAQKGNVYAVKEELEEYFRFVGREKTLISIALVFALHVYKPTPLYFMDEIDAALDFRNVSIVTIYIKNRTKNAQFIIISVRNNMFELSNGLIGIYKTPMPRIVGVLQLQQGLAS